MTARRPLVTISGAVQEMPSGDVLSPAVWGVVPTALKTASYTLVPGDLAMADASGANRVFTLPTAPLDNTICGAHLENSASSHTLTLNTGGSDTIDDAGATSYSTALVGTGAIWIYQASRTCWVRVAEIGIGITIVSLGYTTPSATATLTNKRITKRVLQSSGPGATPTLNTDNYDVLEMTALATAITSMTTNLTGTPTIYQPLLIVFKDNGTARAITWGASFEACGTALPTTTVISKRLTVAFLYGIGGSSAWGCVGSAQEA